MEKARVFSDKLDVEKCFQHNAGYESVSKKMKFLLKQNLFLKCG